MNNDSEKHICVYCGNEANFQFKNGKWCCAPNMNGCPSIKQKRSKASLNIWNEVRRQGKNQIQDAKLINHKYQKYPIKNKLVDVPEGYCQYGCGNKANFILKNGVHCCSSSSCKCPTLRKRNSDAIKLAHKKHFEKTGKRGFGDYYNYTPEQKAKMAWSKGLTKETCESLRKQGESFHKRVLSGEIKIAFKGKHHTDETKNKIVEGMQRSLKDAKFRGIYKGYNFDSTWELAWITYNLEHNIQFERNHEGFNYISPLDNQQHRFFPDFVLKDGTLIEIKGYVGDLANAKIETVRNHFNRKIELIGKEEMKMYLDYVINKYGKDFYNILNENKK